MVGRVARARVVALLTVVLVAGCTGGDESTEPSPTPTPPGVQPAAPSPTVGELADVDWLATSWGTVMAMGDEDGGSTVEQAVAAWQVAFGPLPDAPAPLPQDVSAPPDGTMALELVARHLDELTPDQLAVVTSIPQLDVTGREERDGPSPSESPTAAGPGRGTTTPVLARSSDVAARSLHLVAQEDFATPPVRPTPDGSVPPARVDRGVTNDERNEWRELALGYWRQLQARSGESLPALDNTIDFEFMVPDASYRTGAWTRPDVRRGQPVCQVVLWNARREPEGTKQSVIAHELFHCAMWVWADSTAQHDSLPWWVIEGLASWVGERLGGTSTYSPRWWGQYLCGACDGAWGLPRASYDAIGWWSFLEDRGAALFPALPTLSRARGQEGSWDAAMALLPDGSARSALASSATRRRDGAAWTMGGAGAIDGARHVPDRGTLAAGSVVTYHARPLEQRGLFLSAPASDDPVLVELEARGWGTARWDRGEDVVAAGGDTTRTWCVGDCTCPDGTDLAPGTERAPRSTSGLRLAPSGGLDAESTMSVEVRRPDEECDEEEPDDAVEVPGATGRSHGDPHLTSFDGFGLDFQAVGEFVLVDAGDLQVQVRYAPVEAPFPVSRNTGLAVRVDDRVVEYGLDGIVVDGAPTEQLDTTTADGTRLAASEASGLRVELPDATTVAMTRTLDVVVHLGPERVASGDVAGLLGDADGDPDDDVALPSGDLLAPPGTLPGHDLLYGDWADAWRLTDATSLFTYVPGESTATHTDRTFPASDTRLADLLDAQRRRAEQACRDAGVTAPDLLQACMLDVGTTDDDRWATNAAEAGALWLAGLLGELSRGVDGPGPDDALAVDLAAAAATCDLASVHDLLDRGAPANGLDEDDGDPPLPLVAAVLADGPDCVDVVRALVDAGASAARPQRGTSQPLPAVHLARDADVLAVLLDSGVDPDLLSPTDLTPLNAILLRARAADAPPPGPLVDLLLAAGADPGQLGGQAPLIQAAEIPDPEAVEALLDAGADPDVAYADGWAPLHAAARQVRDPDDLDILDALSAAGADLDATEAFGQTPIHVAVLNVNVAAVERLVALGADACRRDADGRLPGELLPSEDIAAALPDCG